MWPRLALPVLLLATSFMAGQGPKSGIHTAHFDTSVRPQDDFFTYVNGGWIARAGMPDDRIMHGLFTELAAKAELDLRELIESISKTSRGAPGSPEQQIGDLYASLMDEARIEALGARPIEAELARIDAIATPTDLASRSGHLTSTATSGPFGGNTSLDPLDPRRVIVTFTQGGTLLPDRDYYLSADPKHAAIRVRYEQYLKRIFTLTKRRDPDGDARAVIALETSLAAAQLPSAEAGEFDRTAARYSLQSLAAAMPGFDWIAWARPQGLDPAADIVFAQPSFFKQFAALVPVTPMPAWRAWLAARHITSVAPFLSSPFAMARFDFFGRTLSGQTAPITRWKRAVGLVNGYLGDAVGRLYVERYFSPEAKRRVESLVADMLEASRQAIREADWMTPATRETALQKLQGLVTKIGYPERWREYSGLEIRADDLVGNIDRAQRFEHAYRMARVRDPGRRGEWLMPPQTVNAYYSPPLNEIIVPAAMLQPPLFQLDADTAVNYGGIGAIIGHELGHGFDERGRNVDRSGMMRDWWTADDTRAFQKRSARLVEQFNAYRSIDGIAVNGALTLGENISDLGGLALAYRAYRISLRGRPAPVIDGFTGDQRFFIGWAQVWRSVLRDEYLRQWLTWIPHAPPRFRANGPLGNIDAFYAAFDVKPGDKLYIALEGRVRIW